MSESNVPVGGDFLQSQIGAARIFTPESLSAESRLLAATMEDFVRKDIVPAIDRIEAHEPGLMPSLLRKSGSIGLLAGGIPERYEGLGLSKTALTLLTEKAAPYLSFAIAMGVHSGVAALPLLLFGTEAQKQKYLPKLASGQIIGAFALSEASSGSDAFAARTRATLSPDGTHYLLTGEKLWTTNGGFADLFTVFAKVDGERFTAFLVDRGTPGLAVGREEQKMGLHGSSTCRIVLQDAQVPVANVLGEVGRGHRPALYTLNVGRFHIGATALGASKECLRMAALFAKQRVQFGHPIADFVLMRHKLATMATGIYLLESMLYRVAGYWDDAAKNANVDVDTGDSLMQASEEYAIECAIIKFFGTEVLGYASDESLQIHGGMGFSEEFPAARMYRDARVFRIFEGTNEINRLTVLDQILRRTASGRLNLTSGSDTSNAASIEVPTSKLSTPLDEVGVLVQMIRAVFQDVLQAGIAAQGEQIGRNQSFAAAVAEIAASLLALECALLRASSLVQNAVSPQKSHLAAAFTIVFAAEARARVEQAAYSAFAAIQTDKCVTIDSDALREIRSLPVSNPTIFLEQIAESALEREGYSF